MRNTLAAALALALAGLGLAGCDRVIDPDPPTDGEPPVVRVETPQRGEIIGNVADVVVTGTVTDADGDVEELTVNSVRADVGADGRFTIAVPAVPGTNLIRVIARDGGNNETTETRAVMAGPLVSRSFVVPDGIAAGISNEAFVAIGDAAAGFITGSDLGAVIAPFNPVVDYGWSGPGDCLFVRGAVTGASVGGAEIDLFSRTGGLSLGAELTDVDIQMHLEYAAACLDGSRDITIHADRIAIGGDLNIAIAGDAFDIHLVNTDTTLTGLDIDLGGIPGAIVDLLQIETVIEWLVPWAVEQFVAPMISDSLGALGETKTVAVLGKQVQITVAPSELAFTTAGAKVRLDSNIAVVGDAGPGFVYVPNSTPDLTTTDGFRIALADDVVDQAFAAFWGAGGMDYTLPLSSGDYGDVGVLFDSVTIEALLPPAVRADGDGALAVVVGDLIASFSRGGTVVTRIAINGEIALSVVPTGETGLALEVADPVIDIDVLDEGVDGANALDREDFESLVSFAATRATHAVSGMVGVIPLPAVGGVMLSDVDVAAASGYVRVDGRLAH
jgi:hypothetical protein